MEGNNSHSYLQEDVSYDDLMNSGGWLGSTEHYQFQQPHQATPSYATSYSTQPSFDHYDLQQASSYPPASYTNPSYPPQSQYQHARPSDVFGPTSYNLDPSLQGLTAYPADGSFSFGPHVADENTIVPQSLQYQMASAQTPASHVVSNAGFQQRASDFSQPPQEPVYFSNTQNGNMQGTENSIQYPTLPSSSFDLETKQSVGRAGGPSDSPSVPSAPPLPQQQVMARAAQNVLRVSQPELNADKNPSSRPRLQYAPFLSWEDVPIQVAPGLKNTLPKYHPRRSRSGKELVPGLDIFGPSTTLARISTTRKVKAKIPKEPNPSTSKYKGTGHGPKLVHDKVTTLRGIDGGAVKSPSRPTETSSSEDESISEEESEYEEDEDMSVTDISEVRSATRPTDVAEATGWDAIGIIWKDPHSNPNADVVKGAIEEYANFVSALRAQLKTNSTKTEEAASRPAEVDELKAARRVLLDSLYQTINVANTLGYPAVVENLGSHQKLVNGLTTTLIECIKTDDFLGKLPKAVFSLLAKFQNMSDELLRKLKFDSITKRWNKKGDDEIKKDITTILANTIEAKARAAKAKKEAQQLEDVKNLRDKIEQSKLRNAESVKAAVNCHPAKRPHDGDSANSKPTKKFASDVAGTPSASKAIPAKRPTNLLGNNLLGISSKPVAKPVPKKREPSPPTESKLGLILQQINEPPKQPKSPEAKPLPPETPEEKKRRERKESRRHLRVKFKEGPDLEEVRLFKHEQAEDEGRQDDMLRDAHDERSEGMMHKQRVSETMGSAMEADDDDYDPENLDIEERPYPDLVGIDFSDLDKSTAFGQVYATRGGEKPVSTPEQHAQERREAVELMVVYTDPKDIPPTPKEPPHGDTGSFQQERELKGPTAPWVVNRLQELQQYPPEYASQFLQQRKYMNAQEKQSRGVDITSRPSQTSQQFDPSASHLSSQPDSAPVMEAAAWENLLRIVNYLKGKPYPPTEPPDWMTDPQQRSEWLEGLRRDNAAEKKREAYARAAQLQAAQYQPPPMMPPPTHPPMPVPPTIINPFPPPQQPNMLPQVPDMNQHVANYLASIQAAGNGTGQAPQQYDYNGWSGGNGQERDYDEHERWDGEREKEGTRSKKKQSHNNKSNFNNNNKDRGYDMKQWDGSHVGHGGHGNEGLFDENGEYKGKKKPCRFWLEGKCAKGPKCTYLHDPQN